ILSALVPPDALENCVLRDVRRIRLHLKSEVDTVIRAELAKRADHLQCRGLLSQARRALRNDVVLAHDGWVSQAIELKSHHRECLRRIQLVRAVVSAHLAIAKRVYNGHARGDDPGGSAWIAADARSHCTPAGASCRAAQRARCSGDSCSSRY